MDCFPLHLVHLTTFRLQMAVRDTAIWAVGRVCEVCVELVSDAKVLEALLPSLFNNLTQKPRIAGNACWVSSVSSAVFSCFRAEDPLQGNSKRVYFLFQTNAPPFQTLSSLVKAIYQTAVQAGTDASGEPETFMLSQIFPHMVQHLIQTSERTDANVNLRNAAYEALMELIKNSPKDCYAVVQQTTIVVLGKLDALLNMEQNAVSAADRSQLRDLISQLCATLQSVLRKMHQEDAPQVADTIMNGLLQIMHRFSGRDNGAVMEEALMSVSALISVIRLDFAKYMDVFKPILFNALASHQERETCVNALGVITDLCTAFEGRISVYADELMQALIALLNVSLKSSKW